MNNKHDPVIAARIKKEDEVLISKVAELQGVKRGRVIRNIIRDWCDKWRAELK